MSIPTLFAGISGLTLAALFGLFAVQEHGDASKQATEHAVHTPDTIKWVDGPPSLPAGARMALLEGDPAKDAPFTMRLRMPDGYRIPAHTHPKVERLTVISGAFNLGMGEKFDQAATKEMPAGTYGFWPAGMKHFGWARGETVVQLHGTGPWSIEYVNPDDDPRKAKQR
jgi:quercetin dioxygenase-like cupin family protein